jgi:hypothetical protein
MSKLFAVYLGGRAPKGNTELHDVVFVAGAKIEETYEQLMDQWFGTPLGLHLDSWMELDVVDGYKISLSDRKPAGDRRLYFVNLGAYKDGEFTEIHASKFLITDSIPEAKTRAKKALLQGWAGPVHTDDIYDVDTCFEIAQVADLYVNLEKTDRPENLRPTNGYHLVPKGVVEDYMKRKNLTPPQRYRRGFLG